MEAVYTLWFLLLSFSLSLVYLLRSLREKPSLAALLPPGPRPFPIVGNLLHIHGELHHSFARLAKAYGPVITLRLGQVTTVLVSSPEMAREVLQKNDLAFSSRTVPDSLHVGRHPEVSMVWMPVNQQWRNLRRICNTELFTTQRLDANQALRRQKVRELVAYVSKFCASRKTVDIGRALFTTTLNLISNTVFSVDFATTTSESSQEFKDLIERILEEAGNPNLPDFFPWLRVFDPQGRRRRSAVLFKKLYAIFDDHIDRRLQTQVEHEDFLSSLLQGEEVGFKLDRFTMKTLFLDLFVAGSETSSIIVEWAMSELLRNPTAMAKARAEIAATIEHGKELEESDMGKLPYLHAVVKETLRMHPPVPFLLPRKAETTAQLGMYTVPAGARVLVNIWGIGRDSTVWPQPEEFKPERFLEKEVDVRGRDLELTPFGAGRRICPGLGLGLRMVHLMLASLLQRFDWRLPDGMAPEEMDMTERFGVTLGRRVSLRAIPVAAGS